jgi:REP element-mobilizing transposase RayT
LGNVIAFFKYQTTKQMNLSAKLWQRNYFEHIIRNNKSYFNIAEYIATNPQRWAQDRFYNEKGKYYRAYA